MTFAGSRTPKNVLGAWTAVLFILTGSGSALGATPASAVSLSGTATSVVVTPPSSNNQIGTPHTVVATVRNESGSPVANASVDFKITNGPNAGLNQAGMSDMATNEEGEATLTYTSDMWGMDTLVACVETGTTDNDICDADEPRASASAEWHTGQVVSHARSLSIRFNDGTDARSTTLVIFGRLRVADGFTHCRSHQPIQVERQEDGVWVRKKASETNRRGRYAVEIRDLAGVYRATALPTTVEGDNPGKVHACLEKSKQKTHVHQVTDSDADGLDDEKEASLGTKPQDPDSDDDGLKDGAEVNRGTNPMDADTDDDTLEDGREVALGSDPKVADGDQDCSDDGFELEDGTSRSNPDTDGDGLYDGVDGDPLNPDSDGDGVKDGDNDNLEGATLATEDRDNDGVPDGRDCEVEEPAEGG